MADRVHEVDTPGSSAEGKRASTFSAAFSPVSLNARGTPLEHFYRLFSQAPRWIENVPLFVEPIVTLAPCVRSPCLGWRTASIHGRIGK